MIRAIALAAVMALVSQTASMAQGQTVTFLVSADPAEDAQELLLGGGTGNTTLPADFSNGDARLNLPAGPASIQPRAIILEWRDGSRAEFPVFIFPEFSSYEIQVRFLHLRSLPKTQAEADTLCRDTRPEGDAELAFKMVFGCRAWTEQLESRQQNWSREYNTALNGWIIGNRDLFRRTLEADNAQLSPFGYQKALIARLREAMERVANGQRADRLRPLNIAEIEDVLQEHDQTLLRYVSQTGSLIKQGQLKEALELNRQAYDVFQTTIAKGDQPSVFRIDENVLVDHMRDLRELLRAQ